MPAPDATGSVGARCDVMPPDLRPFTEDLDRLVTAVVQGRALRLAAWTSAGLVTLRHVWVWDDAGLRHRLFGVVLGLLLLGLALAGRSCEGRFVQLARARAGLLAPPVVWVALMLLGQRWLLAPVALPWTLAWLLARGWRPTYLLAGGWFVLALLMHRWMLAPLPAAAVLLRRRPSLAFGAVLALAALVRLAFVLALPRPIWSPDSWGYVLLAYQLLGGGEELGWAFTRPPHLAGLMLVSLWFGGNQFWFVVLTHLTGFGAAWWVSCEVRRRLGDLAGWQACAALALCPELLVYEHSVLSEGVFLASLSVMTALLLELRPGAAPGWGRVVALGLATGAFATARPVAMLSPIVVVAAAGVVRWPWRRVVTLAVASVAPVLLVCSLNLAVDGFFGLSSPLFRAYVWFSVTAHGLDFDSPLHAQVKAEMRETIERHNARRPPWDPDAEWMIFGGDGPIRASSTLGAMSADEQSRVLTELAREALARDPLGFARRAAYQLLVVYLLAVPAANDGPFPTWEEWVDRWAPFDDTLPARYRHLHASPAPVTAFEGEATYRVVELYAQTLNGGWGVTVFGTQPFSAYRSPWLLLPLLVWVCWRPRLRAFRPAALTAATIWAVMIVATCVVHTPYPRYRLPAHSVGVLLVAIACADPRRVRGPGR